MRATMLPSDWLAKDADQYEKLWPEIEPLLERACHYSGGRFSTQSIREGVLKKDLQLWVAFAEPEEIMAVAVTHLCFYPTGKKLAEVILLGGRDRKLWMHFEDVLLRWARKEKCAVIACLGRKGWKKDLADWTVTAWSYEKEL